MAQIGQRYQLDTWDIIVESLTLENDFLLNGTDLVLPQASYTFLIASVQATLTGSEPEIFFPSRADEALGRHAEDGMTMIRGNLNHTLYFRADRIVANGIVLQGSGDWTIANTQFNPGETISGLVIFQFLTVDVMDEDSEFRITIHQRGGEPILRFDLRELL